LLHKDIQEILYTAEDIQLKVKELGKQISWDYAGRNLLVICVLKGAVIFMAD
jgi:hypoxanthine phosphoribosyltransferase